MMPVQFSSAAAILSLAALAGCARTTAWPAPQPVPVQAAPPAAEPEAHRAVRALLDAQTAAWNRHDLDGFLAGYRRDEHVVFTTPEGSSRGFEELEQRYRKSYNTPEKFGVLAFGDLAFESIDSTSVIARGAWRLSRANDSPHGRFVLVVCRLPEGWRIVSDFTTVETGG
jgi:beta-aspartyl-peptidase (threonine type)